MYASISITGESLHEGDVSDNIPGATPFFQVDLDDDYAPPEGLPSNPHEYLKSVMHEARNTPDVVVAKIDPRKMKPKARPVKYRQSCYMIEQFPDKNCFAPSKTWQEKQLADFAITREEYIRHLAKLKSISRQTKRRPKLPIYPLPPWDDEISWKYLCFGKNMTRQKKENKSDEDELNGSGNESDDEDSNEDDKVQSALGAAGRTTTDIAADEATAEDRTVDLSTLEEGFPPMMRILLRMDPSQVEANLDYHARWMDEDGFSHDQGRWIYALLSCLDKPLFPTVISVLRDLSRKCIELRSKMQSRDDALVNGLNLMICIVGRYFDQTDLADSW